MCNPRLPLLLNCTKILKYGESRWHQETLISVFKLVQVSCTQLCSCWHTVPPRISQAKSCVCPFIKDNWLAWLWVDKIQVRWNCFYMIFIEEAMAPNVHLILLPSSIIFFICMLTKTPRLWNLVPVVCIFLNSRESYSFVVGLEIILLMYSIWH